MARTSITAVIFLVVCVCLAKAKTEKDVHTVRRNLLAGQLISGGWWYSLKPKNATSYCGLRDFPPANSGYGASRLYCIFPTYDHYWMWQISKVDGSGNSNLSSGDKIFLSIYNPMPYKFCQSKSNVMCGYQNGTVFTIERATGSGSIDLATDDVLLRVSSRYCSLSGSGHGQQLTCSATKSKATVFQFLASSFSQSQLINLNTLRPCGGYFYSLAVPTPDTISCSNPVNIGFTTGLTIALQTPGSPIIEAGTAVSFKSYDDFYTYHVATWMQRSASITYALEETQGNGQWFTMERLIGDATGGVLLNGTAVALRSTQSGATFYCGQKARNATVLLCDNPGPIKLLPDGYRYMYYIVA
ncbi:hypothetical protein Vretimale_16869 [Volvox reticuliferus]|uniref:Uncharacterized protein n=1 Tax=Volvox reticuliferus TaxID=1737510 RepID=A0A8J4CUG7_9CHLO|nr:hypothetical protein Vretifemale_16727 [Volvox reticuliferus]GIM13813.1 hypothetical protein Vretimale_16869 [Volvox reticuliferus]